MFKSFNADRLLICIFILKEYGTGIKYRKCEKNIVVGALSKFPLDGIQETTQESIYEN